MAKKIVSAPKAFAESMLFNFEEKKALKLYAKDPAAARKKYPQYINTIFKKA